MVQGENGQLLQQQLLMAPRCYYALSLKSVLFSSPFLTCNHDKLQAGDTTWHDVGAGHATWGHAWHPWHAGTKLILVAVFCHILFQMGIPGGMGGLVSSQHQLFARPPMLGLPGQQGRA